MVYGCGELWRAVEEGSWDDIGCRDDEGCSTPLLEF